MWSLENLGIWEVLSWGHSHISPHALLAQGCKLHLGIPGEGKAEVRQPGNGVGWGWPWGIVQEKKEAEPLSFIFPSPPPQLKAAVKPSSEGGGRNLCEPD